VSGVFSTTGGGGGDEAATGGVERRLVLDDRGGVLGRSVVIGFKLGVPGRGGAEGNELSRLEPSEGGVDGDDFCVSGAPSAIGGADGIEGIVGSEFLGGFDSVSAGAPDFRFGGGGGECEARAGWSTSSINASASISGSSFGSWIIVVICCSSPPVLPKGRTYSAEYHSLYPE
jgi:hypothetical protein